MNITNKIFSYSYSSDIRPEVAAQYRNSLIFLGEAQQIWVPATGAYVGIGTTAYNNVLGAINGINSKIQNYDEHLNKYVTRSLQAQLTSTDINNHSDVAASIAYVFNGTNQTQIDASLINTYSLQANQNVIVRGINPVTTYVRGTGGFYNAIKNSSGVNVTIEHGGTFKEGVDANGLSYSYWEGEDILSIDDSFTWSYFNSKIDQSLITARQFAIDQANAVYDSLLGNKTVNYINKDINLLYTVEDGQLKYIGDDNKNTTTTAYVKRVINTLPNDKTAYVNNGEYFEYIPVEIDGNDLKYTINDTSYTIYTLSNGVLTPTDNMSYINPLYGKSGITPGSNEDSLGITIKDYNNNINVILYEADSTNTNGQVNIIDGINTIKEVAYILDVITDGSSDGAINIAYNIAKNSTDIEWLKGQTVSLMSGTVNNVQTVDTDNYITLYNYNEAGVDENRLSKGSVIINASANVAKPFAYNGYSYVAYTRGQFNDFQQKAYKWIDTPTDEGLTQIINDGNNDKLNGTYAWIALGDILDNNYDLLNNNPIVNHIKAYMSDNGYTTLTFSGSNLNLKNIQRSPENQDLITGFSSSGLDSSSIEFSLNNNVLSVTNHAGTNLSSNVILFNHRKIEYKFTDLTDAGVLDALTNVDWVTSYVANVRNEIQSGLGLNDETTDFIHEMFASYNAYIIYDSNSNSYVFNGNESTYSNKYVNYTYQIGTYIHQSWKELPKDTVTTSVFNLYTKDNYIITKSKDFAIDSGLPIYVLQGSTLQSVNTNELLSLNPSPDTIYLKVSNSSMTAVSGGTVLNENTQYYTVKSGNYYVPVDIHEVNNGDLEYATLNSADNTLKAVNGKLFVISVNTPSNSKYIDTITYYDPNGANHHHISAYITYLSYASESNIGLADAYDVRRTIEEIFTWVDISTGKNIN